MKNIFDIPESAFSPITTVSAPLPYIKRQDTESSEIKSSIYQNTSRANNREEITTKTIDDIKDEQTPIVGKDYSHEGCACLIM